MPAKIRALLAAVVVLGPVLAACAGSVDDAAPETRTFGPVDTRLTITKDTGRLDVRTGDVTEITVTRWLAGDPANVTWERRDNQLTLATDCGLANPCEVRYEVLVPHDTALTITGDNGPITVENITADLDLTSTSGDLRATGITAARVRASAESGQVELSFAGVPDDVTVTTQNGAVTVTTPPADYRVTTDTDNGEVRNGIPNDPNSAHVISVRTDNGAVTLRTAAQS
ncbi:DUF4097 family beta strand repeat-containing protein [Amycolatopsis taiwanensis]|uniref:DUF4097 family beta strand repeat-containing protein n=1 Tax=Amycolatopsis taiwanensis TaxID=342230 RepID=UPI0004B4120E|nr:DUF4097 family beta strand repeat-containing protein [Amycolatopsis taiwanensis]